MDKFEYRVRTEQMLEYLEKKSYKKAMEIADSIDWRKVKNAAMLCSVSEIYEFNGEYQKSRDILFIAYDRSPGSRKIIYRLGTLALKIGDIEEAADCHEEFVKIAPKDPNQFILHFKILRAQKAPIKQQIEVLENFKKAEYVEKWAYELARLYHEAGMTNECIEECDDLILWFSEGKYVYQAMELKMKYKPLTSMQKEKYEKQKLESLHKPMFRQEEEVIEKQDIAEAGESENEPDESAGDTKVLPKIDVRDLVDGAARDASTLKTTVSGATFAEALENGVAVASGRVPAGTSQPRAVSSIRQEPEKEVKPPKTAETAEEKSPVVTGQMKIDEILKEWEEKQRENAAVIQEKQKEVKTQRETETISVKPETASLVSEEILELIEDLESDEEPVIEQDLELEEKYRDLPVEEPEEDLENMGSIVEAAAE